MHPSAIAACRHSLCLALLGLLLGASGAGAAEERKGLEKVQDSFLKLVCGKTAVADNSACARMLGDAGQGDDGARVRQLAAHFVVLTFAEAGTRALEEHEDRGVLAHIQGVFEKTGNAEAGKALLEDVSREIIQINNQGVLAARSGDFDGSVQLLIEAAERVPNLQFLVNAAKSIYTLMDQKGWQPELAERAHRYLEKARSRSPDDPRVISGRDMYQRVARKYGVQVDTDS